MKPFIHNGKRMFPVGQKFLGQLAAGELFRTKHGKAVYTVGENFTVLDDQGKEAYMPTRMPVIQLKSY